LESAVRGRAYLKILSNKNDIRSSKAELGDGDRSEDCIAHPWAKELATNIYGKANQVLGHHALQEYSEKHSPPKLPETTNLVLTRRINEKSEMRAMATRVIAEKRRPPFKNLVPSYQSKYA
jgi:hypothetical protein